MHQARPSSVSVATALQLGLAGLLLLMAVLAVAGAVHYDGVIDQAARAARPDPSEVGIERSANAFFGATFAALALALAVWFGVTAIGMRRGSNVARILALVGLGFPLLAAAAGCALSGLFGLAFAGLLLAAPGGGDPAIDEAEGIDTLEPWTEGFYAELDRLAGSGWSTFFDVADSIGVVLVVMLSVAVGVLLLIGTSNRFFRPAPPPPPLLPAYYFWSGHPRA